MRGKIARELRALAGQTPPKTKLGFALGVRFIPLPKTYRHRYQVLKKRFYSMGRNPVSYKKWWYLNLKLYDDHQALKEQQRQKYGRSE